MVAARDGVKVLFVSGHAERLLSEHGITDSHVNILTKPFSPAALCVEVRRIIDTPTGNDQSEAGQ